jgi:hypothetical protein
MLGRGEVRKVTRLRTGTRGSFGLEEAFRTLGRAPSRRDLAWVADRLREAGVRLDYRDDREWHELVEVAEACSSGPFVALDLVVAVESGVEALSRGPRYARIA